MRGKTFIRCFWWISLLLAKQAANGEQGGIRSPIPAKVVPSTAPIVTILPSSTGALVRSYGAGNAGIDLGQVAYFKGTSGPGQSKQKTSKSFIITTRFALKVDCPGGAAPSRVEVTMSRLDAAPSHAITIDGLKLGPSAQTLASSMPCGAVAEHRLELEVPVSTPAGSIGSNVVFVATLR